ncbi:MAG: universal stress protein [Candidatus Limiplasma sp.]|nr:universal stress protein [Candidatus Limiplasma sp.]
MLEQSPVMVLVTMQRMCARLIRLGADQALRQGCPLKVVHVASTADVPEGQAKIDAQVLNYLYALANEAGAEMCVLTSDVPVTAIAEYAVENQVGQIIMGGGGEAGGIAQTLCGMLPGVKVAVIEEEMA